MYVGEAHRRDMLHNANRFRKGKLVRKFLENKLHTDGEEKTMGYTAQTGNLTLKSWTMGALPPSIVRWAE